METKLPQFTVERIKLVEDLWDSIGVARRVRDCHGTRQLVRIPITRSRNAVDSPYRCALKIPSQDLFLFSPRTARGVALAKLVLGLHDQMHVRVLLVGVQNHSVAMLREPLARE
jgi:hypothetical protein